MTTTKPSKGGEGTPPEYEEIPVFEKKTPTHDLVGALTVARKARDDDLRRAASRQMLAPVAIAVLIGTAVWYPIFLIVCYALSVPTVAIGYSIVTLALSAVYALFAGRRSSALPPVKPKDMKPQQALLAAAMYCVGPVAYGPWFVDVYLRGSIDNNLGTESAQVTTSQLMADDRVRLVLVPLQLHLERWRWIIVPPNRWIASVNAGLGDPAKLNHEHIDRVRRYGEMIDKLLQLAEALLKLEGPLGDAASRNRTEDDIFSEIGRLMEQLDVQFAVIEANNLRLEANMQLTPLTTEEVPRFPPPETPAPN